MVSIRGLAAQKAQTTVMYSQLSLLTLGIRELSARRDASRSWEDGRGKPDI